MTKVKKPWEKDKDAVHSPEGVRDLKRNVKYALIRKYTGIAETMFKWELPDAFSDMETMSHGTLPEKYLLNNGFCCVFAFGGQLHILPAVYDSALNIYGYSNGWSPVPIGWDSNPAMQNDPAMQQIRNMHLDATNSVIIENDLFGDSDKAFIDSMVNLLVDHTLTLNQLQLLSRSPLIFAVSEDNLLTAKALFLKIGNCEPVAYVNRDGDEVENTVINTNVKIDASLFDLYSHWESMLLQQLGISSGMTPKRAQQTEAEVSVVMGDDLVSLRRKEKLWQRQRACDRISEVFGAEVSVISLLDTLEDDAMAGNELAEEQDPEKENGQEASE